MKRLHFQITPVHPLERTACLRPVAVDCAKRISLGLLLEQLSDHSSASTWKLKLQLCCLRSVAVDCAKRIFLGLLFGLLSKHFSASTWKDCSCAVLVCGSGLCQENLFGASLHLKGLFCYLLRPMARVNWKSSAELCYGQCQKSINHPLTWTWNTRIPKNHRHQCRANDMVRWPVHGLWPSNCLLTDHWSVTSLLSMSTQFLFASGHHFPFSGAR